MGLDDKTRYYIGEHTFDFTLLLKQWKQYCILLCDYLHDCTFIWNVTKDTHFSQKNKTN